MAPVGRLLCSSLFVVLNLNLNCLAASVNGILSETAKVNQISNKICDSPDCIKTAEMLKTTMDFSVNPCDNYYQFVCGNFPKVYPPLSDDESRDWFNQREQEVLDEVKSFLSNENYTSIESVVIQKARKIYSSCVSKQGNESLEVDDNIISGALRKVGLPLRPGDGRANSNDKNASSSSDWVSAAAKIKTTIGKDVFFAIGVGRDPNKTRTRRIVIGKPNSNPNSFVTSKRRKIFSKKRSSNNNVHYDATKFTKAISNFGKVIERTLPLNEQSEITNTNENPIMNAVSSVIRKAELEQMFNDDSSEPTVMTLNELQKFTDNVTRNSDGSSVVHWATYLKYIFNETEGVDLTFQNGNQLLVVYDLDYIAEQLRMLRCLSPQEIETAVWLELVMSVSEFSSEELRKAKNDLDTAISGEVTLDDRTVFCAKRVSRIMALAVSYYLVVEPKFNIIRNKVVEMVNNVQSAFHQILEQSNWMDRKTQLQALEKEMAMKAAYIAYPRWLKNTTFLDKYYDEQVGDAGDYEEAEFQYRKETTKKMLKNILITDEEDPDQDVVIDPIDVNAAYNPDDNSVTLPAGVLGFPFYRYGLQAMNYGGIGVVIGHEITHGFDNSGRMFDQDGHRRDWWANKTASEYERRAKCFVDSYGSYKLKVANESLQIDGSNTLNENIADNGGFREALYAYRKYTNDNGPEPLLPGFENYTHEQLLTIAYANMQCEASTLSSLKDLMWDVHSPGPARAWGVAVNSEEFVKIWNCKEHDKMNPKSKCRVW